MSTIYNRNNSLKELNVEEDNKLKNRDPLNPEVYVQDVRVYEDDIYVSNIIATGSISGTIVGGNHNGFQDDSAQTCSFTDGTRLFTIAPTGVSFTFFSGGGIYTKTALENLTITTTNGVHLLYYNGSTLAESINPSNATIQTIMENYCIVSWIYWDSSTPRRLVYSGDNFTGVMMDGATKNYIYEIGPKYLSGVELQNLLVDQDGSLDTHAQFGINAGEMRFIDMNVTLNSFSSTVGTDSMYRFTNDWRRFTHANFSLLISESTGRLTYDNGGSLVNVTNNYYVCVHIFAVLDDTNQYFATAGWAEYAQKADAFSGASSEIIDIGADLPFKFAVPLFTFIYQTSDSYTNAVKSRVVSNGSGLNYLDWRNNPQPLIAFDHHELLNLNYQDDHPRYFQLAGRSGGQQLIGGTASGNNLTFDTTSHGSKGDYIFTDLTASKVLGTGSSSELITSPDLSSDVLGGTNITTSGTNPLTINNDIDTDQPTDLSTTSDVTFNTVTGTTQLNTGKIYNGGDITIDALNATADSEIILTNSNGTYDTQVIMDKGKIGGNSFDDNNSLIVYQDGDAPILSHRTSSSTNSVLRVLELIRCTSGTATAGIGLGIGMRACDFGGSPETTVEINAILNDVSPSAEQGTLQIKLVSDSSLFTVAEIVASTGDNAVATLNGDLVIDNLSNNQLVSTDGTSTLTSVSDLSSWVTSTGGTIIATQNGSLVNLEVNEGSHSFTEIILDGSPEKISSSTGLHEINMFDTAKLLFKTGGTAHVEIEGNDSSGDAKLFLFRTTSGAQSVIRFKDASGLWDLGTQASSSDFSIQNVGTSNFPLKLIASDDSIEMDGTLKVDTITELGTSGVDIMDLNINDSTIQNTSGDLKFDASDDYIFNYNSGGNCFSEFYKQSFAGDITRIRFYYGSTLQCEIGVWQSANDLIIKDSSSSIVAKFKDSTLNFECYGAVVSNNYEPRTGTVSTFSDNLTISNTGATTLTVESDSNGSGSEVPQVLLYADAQSYSGSLGIDADGSQITSSFDTTGGTFLKYDDNCFVLANGTQPLVIANTTRWHFNYYGANSGDGQIDIDCATGSESELRFREAGVMKSRVYLNGSDDNLYLECNANTGLYVTTSGQIFVPNLGSGPGTSLELSSGNQIRLSSSVRESKMDITDISDDWDWIYIIPTCKFKYRKQDENMNYLEEAQEDSYSYGMIAQDVELIKPDFCTYNSKGDLRAIKYMNFIAPLIEAVKSQKKQIDDLKKVNDQQQVLLNDLLIRVMALESK